ncbi:MAG TPA: Gfo/Idh/MocA family oxidoreductase [Chitinophagaceae bacterium]
MKRHNESRRKFICNLGLAGLSLPLISCMDQKKTNTQTMTEHKKAGKLGIALVGLGGYAGGQLAPALQQTENCYLAGIVTGTPSKIPVWKEKYNIPDKNVYNYENFVSIKDNPDIDIVYVVLPNSMHAEYTIRAAKAGKHVICEKPMALSVDDCDKMIKACKDAGKSLSIGYRLHFEPYNLEMVRLGTKKIYGNIKKITAGFGFMIGDPTQWRLKKDMAGGGPMQDLGIYCVQGICYTTGLEPIAVTAQEGPKTIPDKFKEVEQSLKWQFDMPGGIIAEGEASYGHAMNFLKAEAEKGTFELSPAYNYGGLKGKTSEGIMNFPNINQQAKQMDGIAMSIKNKQTSIVPGELGKRDVKIIAAVYEAMRTGKKIKI